MDKSQTQKYAIAFLVGVFVGLGVSWLMYRDTTDEGGLTVVGSDSETGTGQEANTTTGIDSGGSAGTDSNGGTEAGATGTIGTESGSTQTGTPTINNNGIRVSDQAAGERIELDELMLTDKSWAVIYEDDRGRPGRILGARRYDAGTYTDAYVKLLRGTETGGVYYALIHMDDGDDTFTIAGDIPITTTAGPIMDQFVAN